MNDAGSEKMSLSGTRWRSFRFAFSGLLSLLKEEQNAVIQSIILIIVIISGVLLDISKTDWITIIIVSASVLAFECFNTAIENLCDFVTTEKNDKIRKIKDLAAAGVLISAIGSAFVGLIIFIPEILDLFR